MMCTLDFNWICFKRCFQSRSSIFNNSLGTLVYSIIFLDTGGRRPAQYSQIEHGGRRSPGITTDLQATEFTKLKWLLWKMGSVAL